MRSLMRIAAAMLAIWGVALSLALAMGWLSPNRLPWSRDAATQSSGERPPAGGVAPPNAGTEIEPDEGAHPSHDDGPAAASDVSDSPAIGTDTEPRHARHVVCPQTRLRPRLSMGPRHDRAQWLALHCGTSVHLLGLEHRPTGPELQRLATLRPRTTGEGLVGAELRWEDVDLDGHPELLVPMPRMRPGQQLQEGKLYRIAMQASGAFDVPRMLIPSAPSDMQRVEGPGRQPGYLAMLIPRPQLVPTAAEVWALSLGPSPVRTGRWKVAPGAERFVLTDLDGDGATDLITAGSHSPLEWRRGAEDGWQTPQSFPEAKGVHSLRLADLTGTGRQEVIIAGDGLWVLRAGADARLERLSDRPVRDVHVLAAEPRQPGVAGEPEKPVPVGARAGDAATPEAPDAQLAAASDPIPSGTQIWGYVHPDVVRLVADGRGGWEHHAVATLTGDLVVQETRFVDLDQDGTLDLLVINQDEAQGPVSLSIIPNIGHRTTLRLTETPSPVRDALLPLQLELP